MVTVAECCCCAQLLPEPPRCPNCGDAMRWTRTALNKGGAHALMLKHSTGAATKRCAVTFSPPGRCTTCHAIVATSFFKGNHLSPGTLEPQPHIVGMAPEGPMCTGRLATAVR